MVDLDSYQEFERAFWHRLYIYRFEGNKVALVFDSTNWELLTGSRIDCVCRSTSSHTANRGGIL
jgi:hypothetical protein